MPKNKAASFNFGANVKARKPKGATGGKGYKRSATQVQAYQAIKSGNTSGSLGK